MRNVAGASSRGGGRLWAAAGSADSWPCREDWQGRDFIVDEERGEEVGRLPACGSS